MGKLRDPQQTFSLVIFLVVGTAFVWMSNRPEPRDHPPLDFNHFAGYAFECLVTAGVLYAFYRLGRWHEKDRID